MKNEKPKKNGVTFVRYGGLSPVKQKGFTADESNRTYHAPPARKGIYAFPEYWVEHFLLGGDESSFGVKNRIVRVKDAKGNLITNQHPMFQKLLDRGEKYYLRKSKELLPGAEPDEDGEYGFDDYVQYLTVNVKPRKFEYEGPLWHHLKEYVPNGMIIKERGSWVFTDIDIYKQAFKNEMKDRRKGAVKDLGDWDPDNKIKDASFLGRNPYKWHSKDHLEVFIERVK